MVVPFVVGGWSPVVFLCPPPREEAGMRSCRRWERRAERWLSVCSRR